MSVDIPAKKQLKNIMREHEDLHNKIEQTEDEEDTTLELVHSLRSEIADGDQYDQSDLRKMIQESEAEVSEIYQELKEEQDIEDKEKDMAGYMGDIVSDVKKDNDRKEKAISGLNDALGEIRKNPSKEGIKNFAKQAGQAATEVLKIGEEEIAGAKGLEKLSEEILETAQEEEELIREIEEEEELTREGDEIFKALGSKKGDKAERRLKEKEDKEEKKALEELEEAESLTEMDKEEIRTLYNQVKRSRKEAEEIYNEVGELIDIIKNGERMDSLDRYDMPDQPSQLSQSEKEKYIEKAREERQQLEEAGQKMNKAIKILEKANKAAKRSGQVEAEAHKAAEGK